MAPMYHHPGAGAGGTPPHPTAVGCAAKEASGSENPEPGSGAWLRNPEPSLSLLPTPFQLTQHPSHGLFSKALSSPPAPLR